MTNRDFRTHEGSLTFGVRSSALIIKDGKLLTVYREADQLYIVPGGAILLGEESQQAAVREVKEELGLTVSADQLAFVVENQFQQDGQEFHNIEFHYVCQLFEGYPDRMIEEGALGVCKWIALDELADINLRPAFLKEKLPSWNGQIGHVVLNER